MDDIEFMNDFIRRAKPHIPLRYGLLEDGRLLAEMDRAEQLASTAHERKREETETKKIVAALEKEKHDAEVVKKRHQQLMLNSDELRRLRYYVNTAKNTCDLVNQLKLQDEKIERRLEEAHKQTLEIRAKYRADAERQKKLEEQKRLEAEMIREELRAQIAVQDMKRAEELEEKIRDGKELSDELRRLSEKDRLQKEADAKAKLQWRREILESLRQRQEYLALQNEKEVKSEHEQLDAQIKREEWNQHMKDMRKQRIEQKHQIAAKIGEKVIAAENAKRKAIADSIDMFVNERVAKEQLAEKLEAEKENERRRMLQNQVALHLEEKLSKKIREQQINLEIALKRKPLTPDEQDNPRTKISSPEKIRETKKFMAEKKEMDREKLERDTEARRQEYAAFVKQTEDHDNDVENAKRALLGSLPIQLLRYLPSSVVRTDYLPEPLRVEVREAVRNEPIPILTRKRHQPHLRGRHFDEPKPVWCSERCSNLHSISNIF